MAQGMEFRWMGQGPSEDEIARLEAAKNDAEELAQLQKANQNANRAVNWMELGEQLGTSGAYQEAIANQAAQEAQKQADMMRIQELQNKIAERKKAVMNDPRMQIAAMLAMGGQPSALSSMLVSSVQGDYQKAEKAKANVEAAQRQLDAIENGIKNDITLLAGMNQSQRDKVLKMSKPLFFANMEKLIAQGAKPNLSIAQWTDLFGEFESKGNAGLNRAQMQKEFDRLSVKNNRTAAEDKRMAYLAEQLRKK